MEEKLTALVFIALLIGLGGGYGLGYLVYQPQILGFQSDLKTIQSDLETIKTDVHDLKILEKPEYEVIYLGRFNITSGKAQYYDIPDWNNPVFAGGYSRLGFSYEIWDMSIGNYDLKLSVAGVTWIIEDTYTLEPVYAANTTIKRSESSLEIATPPPALIEIKAPYFALEFRTDTEASNWWDIWVVIDVYAYLRNE